jgi:hypothetical protein
VQCDHRQFDFGRRDLLADEFWGPADHQPGDKDGDNREQQHAEEARADAADDHFVEHHVRH